MFGPLVLTLLGLVAAVVPALVRLPNVPDPVPLALLAAGAVWGFVVARRRRPGRGRFVVAGAQAAVLLAIAYWMLLFSAYTSPPGDVPVVGDAAPPIEATRVKDGARFELRAQRGTPFLLVFFRGDW